MSFMGSFRLDDKGDVLNETFTPQQGNGAEESKLAYEEGRMAAEDIVSSGVLGKGTFRVQISGHTNDGNKPVPGWSNDFLSINISQE